MRCARRIGCLAGLTRLRSTGLSSTGLGRLLRLNGLRLNGLLRCYRCGRLSSITRLARLHGLARLSSLARKRSVLRGVCAGVVAVASGYTLRRVVGSVLRH